MNIPIRRFIYCILLALLTACSQIPTAPIDNQTQSSLPIPENWQIIAKLGIKLPEENYSLTTTWKQKQDQYDIRLTAPLGQGSGHLQGDSDFITITRAGKQTLYSNRPSELVSDAYGWSLPLEHLSYWVRGLPSQVSTPEQEIRDESKGVLLRLQQEGWRLEYSRYRMTDQWLMPHRIKAQKDTTELTLIIKQWQFVAEE